MSLQILHVLVFYTVWALFTTWAVICEKRLLNLLLRINGLKFSLLLRRGYFRKHFWEDFLLKLSLFRIDCRGEHFCLFEETEGRLLLLLFAKWLSDNFLHVVFDQWRVRLFDDSAFFLWGFGQRIFRLCVLTYWGSFRRDFLLWNLTAFVTALEKWARCSFLLRMEVLIKATLVALLRAFITYLASPVTDSSRMWVIVFRLFISLAFRHSALAYCLPRWSPFYSLRPRLSFDWWLFLLALLSTDLRSRSVYAMIFLQALIWRCQFNRISFWLRTMINCDSGRGLL